MTFDGEECKPVPIDAVLSQSMGKAANVHRPGVISGHCKINKAGTVIVALNIGNCDGTEHVSGDAYTGWNSATRIYLEEIQSPQ